MLSRGQALNQHLQGPPMRVQKLQWARDIKPPNYMWGVFRINSEVIQCTPRLQHQKLRAHSIDSIKSTSAPSGSGSARLLRLSLEDEAAYEQFAQTLMLTHDFFDHLNRQGIVTKPNDFDMVDISRLSIVAGSRLPGLNDAKCVCIDDTGEPTDQARQSNLYVFKGSNFQAWQQRKEVKEPWKLHKRALYSEHSLTQELTVLCSMPLHHNIIPKPPILVLTPTSPKRICGFLQPFRAKQTIAEQIRLANNKGDRIPLPIKARWCLGIVEASLHTHRVAKTFHMDMKPGNVLVEDDDTVRVIDWQQQGMCRATHPPEATLGSNPKIQKIIDKMRLDQDGQPTVMFTPQPGTWPEEGLREAYVRWKAENTRGIEAVELFKLFMTARTLWHILEQREETTGPTVWSEKSRDIPETWREAVEACLVEDLAKRPALETVVEFWREQVKPSLSWKSLP